MIDESRALASYIEKNLPDRYLIAAAVYDEAAEGLIGDVGDNNYARERVPTAIDVLKSLGSKQVEKLKFCNSWALNHLSDTISEIYAAASETRILKYSQYNQLTTVASNYCLDKKHLAVIERLMYFVKKGRIQLVDDLS